MIKVDLHVHSEYSHDSTAKIYDILKYAKQRHLDAIAITDHDTFEGNLEARRIRNVGDVQIIPGIELTIPGGEYGLHVIALYIEKKPKIKNLIQVINEIKDRGGIVIIPHPFRPYTGLFWHQEHQLLGEEAVNYALENADYIEGLNLKDRNDSISQTLQFIERWELCPKVAVTDTHLAAEVGIVHTEVQSLDDLKSGAKNIRQIAHIRSGASPQSYNLGPSLLRHDDYLRAKGNLYKWTRASAESLEKVFPGFMRTHFVQLGLAKLLLHSRNRKIQAFIESSQIVEVSKDDEGKIIFTTIKGKE